MDIVSVSDITRHIKNLMLDDGKLRSVYIRGEVSNFKLHYSGHCYFTLKDASSSIKAVMFKSRAGLLKFLPANGMKLVAAGAVAVFERDGQYQLYVDTLYPEGVGELSIAFEQLKEKLAGEGLFLNEHKKSLPKFPKVIGVVTSATGAAARDIYTVTKRRNPNISLRLYPVLVQGEGAAAQIAAAIDFFNRAYPVDALIVGRGGGSIEDLWAFNEEVVVRAVYRSEIPVISAVGHETDFTLTDFAADVRAATPSQAAELAAPDARETARYIESLAARLEARRGAIFREKADRLSVCLKNKSFQNPALMLNEKKQAVDGLLEQLNQRKNTFLVENKHNLTVLMEKLEMLDPLRVLKRGYGLAEAGGRAVSSVRHLAQGDEFQVVLADGRIHAVATEIRKEQAEDGLFNR